jgi:hypothetical protein
MYTQRTKNKRRVFSRHTVIRSRLHVILNRTTMFSFNYDCFYINGEQMCSKIYLYQLPLLHSLNHSQNIERDDFVNPKHRDCHLNLLGHKWVGSNNRNLCPIARLLGQLPLYQTRSHQIFVLYDCYSRQYRKSLMNRLPDGMDY